MENIIIPIKAVEKNKQKTMFSLDKFVNNLLDYCAFNTSILANKISI